MVHRRGLDGRDRGRRGTVPTSRDERALHPGCPYRLALPPGRAGTAPDGTTASWLEHVTDVEYQENDITREHLLTCDLSGRPGRVDRVEIYQVTLPPGKATGRHNHPGGVADYVTSGEIAFEPEGQPGRELRARSAFFEPAAATIGRFDNVSAAEPATFIACYLLTGDEPLIQPL